jgi:hypothetical protein
LVVVGGLVKTKECSVLQGHIIAWTFKVPFWLFFPFALLIYIFHFLPYCKVCNCPKLAKDQIKTLHKLKISRPSDFFGECWNP